MPGLDRTVFMDAGTNTLWDAEQELINEVGGPYRQEMDFTG